MVYLDSDNIREYVEQNSAELFPGYVFVSAEEINEQTYVNWIFRVEIKTTQNTSEIFYLRQSRDHVKTRPEISVRPDRVGFESRILALIDKIVADTVPQILWFDAQNNIIALTDIRRGAPLLVNELVEGRAHAEAGFDFGKKIGQIHGATHTITDDQVRGDAADNADAIAFHLGMRLGPAKQAYPKELAQLLADGEASIQTLVLGDLASKNIFVDGTAIRFLDLERAWRGDPAFDAAFLFSHYLLEVPPKNGDDSIEFIANFMGSYRSELLRILDKAQLQSLENRMIRYLGVCILYRIDGLYLVVDAKEDKELWRERAGRLIVDVGTKDIIEAVRSVVK